MTKTPTFQAALSRFLPWATWLAMLGIVLSLVPDTLQASHWIYPGTDFRVVLSASWALAHGANPYDLRGMSRAYRALGWPLPATFAGRAPVYPPETLVLLMPWLLIGGIASQWIWLLCNGAAVSLALRQLLRWSRRQLRFNVWQEYATLVIAVIVPTLAFTIDIGNGSVMASSCCIAAFCMLDERPTAAAWLLAISLLLKPQLAVIASLPLWIMATRGGRRSLLKGYALAVAATLGVLAVLLATGHLVCDLTQLRMLLRSEQGAGSMSPTYLEVLPVYAQITSLSHLLVLMPISVTLAACLQWSVVLSLLAVLVWMGWRVHWQAASAAQLRLLYMSAWVAVGLLASYHRAHDGLVMLLMVPWVVWQVAQRNRLLLTLLIVAFGWLLTTEVVSHRRAAGAGVWLHLVYYRQAALVALGLAVCLVAALVTSMEKKAQHER